MSTTHVTDNDSGTFSEQERNAMRAYLQRTEVRLSTLHRTALAFISGAGIMILLPVFFKDELASLIRLFLEYSAGFISYNHAPVLTIALFLSLFYLFSLSMVIPVYGMYLLLKDVFQFYFTIYTPGFSSDLQSPAFVLSGVGFSPDESKKAKEKILQYQYLHAESVNFAIPFAPNRRRAYLDEIIKNTDGDIIPTSRQWEAIKDVMPSDIEPDSVNRFGAAFGLARSLDRYLVEEVATSEISLVRHIIFLRRLMLRYMKALLMLIWTTITIALMLPFAQDGNLPTFFVLSVGYFIWALFVYPVMKIPSRWLYRHVTDVPDEQHMDAQLVILETHVKKFCMLAIPVAALAVVLSGIAYFG